MAFFENIEIQKLFCAEEADTFPPFTEKDLAETEINAIEPRMTREIPPFK